MSKITEYLSRKFLLSLLSLVGVFVLVWNNKPVDELAWSLAIILGFYSGSNVVQDYVFKRPAVRGPARPRKPKKEE